MKIIASTNRMAENPGLSRTHLVVQTLAKLLLEAEVGDKLARLTDLQRACAVGAGTVQSAIKYLEDIDAVSLRRAGHLGTQIEFLAYDKLLALSGREEPKGVFPTESAPEVRGAIKRIRSAFKPLNISFRIGHEAGARTRLERLRMGDVDFALVSLATARAMKGAETLFDSVPLGPHSFYREGSLNVVTRPGFEFTDKELRIGIDYESSDHQVLVQTELARYPAARIIECKYMDVPRLLLENKIDCSIWHDIDMIIPLETVGIRKHPIQSDAAHAIVQSELSIAVLVTRKENRFISRLLREVAKPEEERAG